MPVATWSGPLLAWEPELSALEAWLAGAFIDGALSGVARKTDRQLAEQAGLARCYRLQSLLGRSHWQADTLRDLVRTKVLTERGAAVMAWSVWRTRRQMMAAITHARRYSIPLPYKQTLKPPGTADPYAPSRPANARWP